MLKSFLEKSKDKIMFNHYFDAIRLGNLTEVKKCLEAGVDINSVNEQGESGLIIASKLGHTDLVEFFLNHEQVNTQQTIDNDALAESSSIAVVGLACRFPKGANSPEEFWQLLRDGKDGISEVPKERWDVEQFYDADKNASRKMYTKNGGFIDQPIDQFDAAFFKITPNEAVMLDPQQRLLLEVTWEAFEQAGIAVDKLGESKTGVFVGIMTHDYSDIICGHHVEHNSYVGSGNGASVLAGRVSYTFGFEGPAITLDTACSSSLVTTHQACQSLRLGESDIAISGGVNAMLAPDVTINCCKAHMLSQDGHCKTFDASADGYSRGEGCGIVILKRLADAKRDGDRILAVIRGSAVNQDGFRSGLTVPNRGAQVRVIREALKQANLQTNDINYIEAHGTGTRLGDPIEIAALSDVFNQTRDQNNPLLVGTVKTNIGHLEAAAGVAGLIKVILSLQNGKIPPHLNFKQLNPEIQMDNTKIHIVTDGNDWSIGEKIRRAGVSSFGFSGTNSHIIVEEAPKTETSKEKRMQERWSELQKQDLLQDVKLESVDVELSHHLLVLSGKNEDALKDQQKNYLTYLQKSREKIGNIAYTASKGRSHFTHRLAVTGDNTQKWQEKLNAFKRDNNSKVQSGKVAFLFTGQGSQYAEMGKSLYETHSVFRSVIKHCSRLLSQELEHPLEEILYGKSSEALLKQTRYAQPALFALEYALAALWESWGIKADVVMGHSVGEYVAAVVSGVLSLSEGLKLIALRGRLMEKTPKGEMLAISSSVEQIEKWLKEEKLNLEIATINSPTQVVVSGTVDEVNKLVERLKEEKVRNTQLGTGHAFHSRHMEPILKEFRNEASKLQYQKANRMQWVSTLSGLQEEIIDGDHWVGHLRKSVDFVTAMGFLKSLGVSTYIEIGSNTVLIPLAKQCIDAQSALWLPSLIKRFNHCEPLLESLGQWYMAGGEVDWNNFFAIYDFRPISLPTYPFQRESYWLKLNDIVTEQPVKKFQQNVNKLLYQLNWQPISLSDSTNSDHLSNSGTWLFLVTNEQLRAKIINALISFLKEKNQKLIFITPGHSYKKISDEHYSIDLLQSSSMNQLVTELTRSSSKLNGVVQLLGLQESNQKINQDDSKIVLASTLHMMQALTTAKLNPPIWVFTRNTQAVYQDKKLITQEIEISHAPMLGFSKAAALEYLGGYQHIDIEKQNDEDLSILIKAVTNSEENSQLVFCRKQWWTPKLKPMPIKQSSLENNYLDLTATYLITGGLGAIGLTLCEWLVQKGVNKIVLMSRHEPSEETNIILKRLQKTGTEILFEKGDVAVVRDVTRVLEKIQRSNNDIAIFHAAGLMDITLLRDLSHEKFDQLLAPKMTGSWNLHEQTQKLNMNVKQFILFSSSASLIPTLGQTAYAAANAVLDQLAHFRQQQGLPATSIHWGLWSVGSDEKFQQRMPAGMGALETQKALQSLELAIELNVPELACIPLNWQEFGKHGLHVSQKQLLQDLLPTATANENTSTLLTLLSNASANDKNAVIKEKLSDWVKQISGIKDNLSDDAVFSEIGVDSLMQVQLRDKLQEDIGTDYQLPPTLTIVYETINQLTQYLLKLLIVGQEITDPVEYMRQQIISSQESSKAYKPVLLSNPKKKSDQPPLFLIHTIMGSVYFYYALCDHLQDRVIYGINEPHFANPDQRFKKLQEMAACYVEMIVKTQPEGSYQICGLSFAGAVAFEVGRQLTEKGKDVTVIMLDTARPAPGHLNLPKRDKSAYVMGEVAPEMNDFYQAEIENNQKLLNAYTPTPFSGRVILLKARGEDSVSDVLKFLDDPCNGWLDIFTPEIYSIPGSHFSLFDNTYAKSTAQKIKYVLSLDNPALVLKAQDIPVLDRLFLHACQQSDLFLALWFLEKGVNVQQTDDLGRNALHWAAINDDVTLAKILMSEYEGEKLNIEDNDHKKPLDYAYARSNLMTFNYLAQIFVSGKSPQTFSKFNMRDLLDFSKTALSSQTETAPNFNRRQWLEILSSYNSSGKQNGLQETLNETNTLSMQNNSELVTKWQESKQEKSNGENHIAELQKINGTITKIELGQDSNLEVMLQIYPEGNKAPLFLIHAASGLALPYLRLTKILDRPLYAISNPFFSTSHSFKSVAEMAADYISRIKKIQPTGPYCLGGWSLGGIVAATMASQLEQEGEQIELVIMIDSVNHVEKPYTEEDEKRAIDNLLQAKKQDFSSTQTQAIQTQYLQTSHLLNGYQAPNFAGRIILLKAQETELTFVEDSPSLKEWKLKIAEDPLSGWQNTFPQLEVYSIPGEHNSLFDEPWIKAVNVHLSKMFAKKYLIKASDLYALNLLIAVQNKDMFIINLLLNQGKHFGAKDENNKNILHFIAELGAEDLLKRIPKEELPFLMTKDTKNRTPASLALQNRHHPIFNQLKNIKEQHRENDNNSPMLKG